MMVIIRFTLAAAVFAFTSTIAQAQTTHKYLFKKGDTFRYLITNVQKGSNRAGDKEFAGGTKQAIEMSWVVESVDDKGNGKIALKYERARLWAESAKEIGGKPTTESREVTSDAVKEPPDDIAKGLYAVAKAFVKLQGTFTLSPRGELQDVTVPDSVMKELKALPGADKANEGWAADYLQGVLKDNLFVLPGVPLTKGKSWVNPVKSIGPFGKLTGETTFVFDGSVTREGRTVDKFTMKPKLKIETDPKAPANITIKLFEAGGAAYFDATNGRLVETAGGQRIEAEAEAMGKTFSQKQETTNSFKLLAGER